MRLLLCDNNGKISLTNDLKEEDTIPPYAILSHTWGADSEELTFADLTNSTRKDKRGYRKIQLCGDQAKKDGLQHFWIDTCCINKANVAEFDHAINSMFQWYSKAAQCYVYLSDVRCPASEISNESSLPVWESDFRRSRWFTRGWTLQELVAPSSVVFYSQEWKRLGDKTSLEQYVHEITGVPKIALQGATLSQFSVNERLLWNKHRQTTREEDKVYSMLGIFDVNMSPFYGEKAAGAFKRLMDKIDKMDICVRDLHITNPWDDKKTIEDTKGGLLKDSSRFLLLSGHGPAYQ